MNIKEKTIQGTIGVGSYRMISQAFSWLLMPILARILEPEDFGLMALATFFINFFNMTSEFGLGNALIQKKELEEEEIHSVFWFIALFNVTMFAILLLIAQPIGYFYQSTTLPSMLKLLGTIFLIHSFRIIPASYLSRNLDLALRAKYEFFSRITGGIITLCCAWAGFRVWSLVYGSLTQHILLMALMQHYHPWRPRAIFQYQKIRGMLRFGITLNISKMLEYLTSNSDNLIVGKILGGRLLGYYNMAFILGTMPIQKTSLIIYRITFPVFSRLQDDRLRLRRYFLKINRYIALFAFPAVTGLFLIAHPLVKVVLTEKWMPILIPLQILCGIGFLKSMAITLSPLLAARGKTHLLLRYSILSGISMPIAFWTGCRYGIIGAACAWVVVYPFLFVYLLRLTLRELGLSWNRYLGNLIFPLSGTTVMALMVVLFQHYSSGGDLTTLAGSCLIGAITFALTIALFQKNIFLELQEVFSTMKNRPSSS